MGRGAVLRAALWAGLTAGLVAALFHLLFTEPLLDQVVAFESQGAGLTVGQPGGAGHPVGAPALPPGERELRRLQRVGLVAGYGGYGLAVGLALGVAELILLPRLPGSPRSQAAWLAALASWAVGLFPALKYPASPPGVGAAAPPGYREGLYLAFVGLSVLIGAAAALLVLGGRGREAGVRSRVAPAKGLWPGVLLGAAAWAALYVAMPGLELVSPATPTELVAAFRARSLAGVLVFWAVFGLLFAAQLPGHERAGVTDRMPR